MKITYDYYGKAYLDCGNNIVLSNRKSIDDKTIINVHNGAYPHVSLKNIHMFNDTKILSYIVFFYCHIID